METIMNYSALITGVAILLTMLLWTIRNLNADKND